MTDAPEQADDDQLCGARLREAREQLNIPISEISKELHLDESKVEALERNEFATLGAPVFAKGHLKKYAQMVKVDTDQILLDFHQLTRADGLPPVISNRKRPSVPKSPMPWIVGAVLVLLGVAAWFGWQFFAAQRAESAASSSDAAAITAPAEIELPTSAPVQTEINDSAAEEPVDARENNLEPEEQVVADGRLRLQLEFGGDCWTEVTDANGDRLFFNLGKSGQTINLEGSAPVSLLLGNANNVQVRVNGRDYSIETDDRDGDTARFTLYGS